MTQAKPISLDKQAIVKFFPFNTLSDTHLNEVFRKIHAFEYAENTVLFKRGEQQQQRFYLLSGKVNKIDKNYVIRPFSAQDKENVDTLDDQDPYQYTVIVIEKSIIFYVEQNYLDLVLTWSQESSFLENTLTWKQEGGYQVAVIDEVVGSNDDDDWMSVLLQSHLFEQIPPMHIQELFISFERIEVKEKDIILTEGAKGDYFYVISQGVAGVYRTKGEQFEHLADLSPGAFFGEDALIADTARNASVLMRSDGLLMRLSKEKFKHLLETPILHYISIDEAKLLIADKMQKTLLIDIRLPQEFKNKNLKGSINVPLLVLRKTLTSLNSDTYYLISPLGNKRCEVAAYIMKQAGFNASIVKV